MIQVTEDTSPYNDGPLEMVSPPAPTTGGPWTLLTGDVSFVGGDPNFAISEQGPGMDGSDEVWHAEGEAQGAVTLRIRAFWQDTS